MTKKEYIQYTERVEKFFKDNNLNNLSQCEDEEEFDSDETCECCGTSLFGRRYKCDGYCLSTKEIMYFDSICWDCLYFSTYSQLDDMTMMDIKDWDDE